MLFIKKLFKFLRMKRRKDHDQIGVKSKKVLPESIQNPADRDITIPEESVQASASNILSDPDGNHCMLGESGDLVELRIQKFQHSHHQTSACCMLPEEILVTIFKSLSISDIITMATTCKSLAQFVSRNFVFKVVLPLSPLNQSKVRLRNVLSLMSTFDATVTHDGHWKDEYLKNIEHVGLQHLQKLVLLGHDENGDFFFHNYSILPPLYHEMITHYLTTAKQLRELHLDIDNSRETFQIIDVIAETLPCLIKVVLLASYHPEKIEIDTEENGILLETGDKSSPMTLNGLLKRLLKNAPITSLEIFGLTASLRSDFILYPLKIQSSTLHKLRIDHAKFCYFKELKCPELREFRYKNLFDDPESKCLVHHHPFADNMNYATLLSEISPKLKMINDIDVEQLRCCMLDPLLTLEWCSQLKATCDCDARP